MTTGSYSKDERKPKSVVSSGATITIYIGRELVKTWSGQDWGSPVSPAVSKRPFSLSQEPADPQNASSFPKRIRGASGRPPRSFYREEHAYTMTASELMHSHVVYIQSGDARQAASVSLGARASFSPPTWTANEQNALIGRLREKLAGSNFNAGVTLGEGAMTLKMLSSSVGRIHSALRSLKRGDIPQMYKALTSQAQGQRYDKFRRDGYLHYDDFLRREKRKAVFESRKNEYDRDLSALWLEAQYGWKPLLQDIHGGAAYIAERLERPDVHTVRARLTIKRNYNPTSQSPTRVRLLKGESRYSKSIVARVSSVNHASLAGLTDPLAVAWELVPWSFVIDWFLPVGDFLNAASFGSSVNATYVISTFRRDQWYGFEAVNPGTLILKGGQGSAYERKASLTREITTSLPAALPKVKPLSESFSWMRAANAAALLQQLRR